MSTKAGQITGEADGDPSFDEIALGISLSGGGIRSAAFSLGMCQRLEENGSLRQATYLSAVSGGSYIAAALAIAHAECPEDLRDEEPPPWGRGSPEEAELRRNLSYLAPGSGGRLWLFANLLYGLILNLAPLLLGAYMAGRLIGPVLGSVYPGLASGDGADLTALPFAIGFTVALMALAIGIVGLRRFFDKDRLRARFDPSSSEHAVMILLVGSVVSLTFSVVLPAAIELVTLVAGRGLEHLGLRESTFLPHRIILGLVIVVGSIALGGVAVWLMRRRRLAWLRSVLAYLSGLGILFAPFLLAAQTGAAAGFSSAMIPLFVIGAVVLGTFGVLVHNRRYSMHLFYRERLQDAFALKRKRGADGKLDVEKIPYAKSIRLSKVARENAKEARHGGPRFPQLVMCAAVAARGSEAPNKAWAASFTFEGVVSKSDAVKLKAKTTDLEKGGLLGGGDVTLPAMMAISGAAVSPLMGRFTLPGFRFLMAMLNIRLGVWLRSPKSNPDDSTGSSLLGRARSYIVRGWREPGALYVLKEALGLASAKGRFFYVSDGGHWENLGLTELLRRGCSWVIVVDASGDPGLGDIGRAIAVARAELSVEFDLDPLPTIANENGLAASPVAVGSFKYPDGRLGTIFYARSVLWEGAPIDLRLLAEHDQLFPNHPTSNQFLSGELFDAYRALGWAVGEALAPQLMLLLD